MPSFFHSTSGNSFSEDDESSSSGESAPESESQDLAELGKTSTIELDGGDADTSRENEEKKSVSPARRQLDSLDPGVMFHSLLEQLCVTKALNHFHEVASSHAGPSRGRFTEDHPDVQAYAAANYQSLAKKLTLQGLLSDTLHGFKDQKRRKEYSQGFQQLWDQEPKPGIQVSSNELVLSRGDTVIPPPGVASIPSAILSLPPVLQTLISHPSSHPSQYQRDFSEKRLLGQGGYGKVYHVKKRLDGSEYAVKKITLNQSRLHKLHVHGEAELDSLLIELRTLAKLKHPNIVRYYNGWLELSSNPGPQLPPITMGKKLLELPGFTSTGVSDVFDSSSEYAESSVGELSRHDTSCYNGPGVTLFLQMDLLPHTLTHYLDQHCFHPRISLKLLLAILDGVQYLHSQGVIHRDLKPDNIFLAPHDIPYPGCVNLADCSDCLAHDLQPGLERIRPLIGDFGLVAQLTHPAREGTSMPSLDMTKLVGTELYVPSGRPALSEKLDVFAIGIIAFELLWKFGTKMERYHVLGKLKKGELPTEFASKCGGNSIEKLIRCMLSGEEDRLTCSQVREMVVEILENSLG